MLAQVWVRGTVEDTQCGFKGFTRAAAVDLATEQRITSIVFDVELIYLARRRGYRMTVVPVRWSDKRGSRMRPRVGPCRARRLGPVPHPAPASPGQARRGCDRVSSNDLHPAGPGRPCRSSPCCRSSSASASALAAAGDTLGFDFRAYHLAIVRLIDGQPLYDMSYTAAGGFGLVLLPAAVRRPRSCRSRWLATSTATWVWIGLSIAVFLAGVAILPVNRERALVDPAAWRAGRSRSSTR